MRRMLEEFPKCPICGSINGYESSGILGSRYAQCYGCKTKWKISTKKGKISELTVHELPKDGSSVYTIASTKAPLFTITGKHLPTDFWKNLKLGREINWEFLSKHVSPDVSKAVFAEKKEQLLHQWEGTIVTPREIAMGKNVHRTIEQGDGVLLLSTQKLRWLEKRKRGFMKPVASFLVVYETPLEEVRGISGGSGDSSDWTFPMRIPISVVDKQGEKKFRLRHAFLEIFKPIVENAIQIRKKEIEAERKKERLHVMLDFSFLKTYMKKGGLVMQVLRCPHCNATIEFPESGTQTKCSYCGNAIFAQDVFEKVKSLLE